MSSYQYSFEKLDVWHDSKCLVKDIYNLTKIFPKSETYGLSNQIQRAAVSVLSNIAEGISRLSDKEKIRFLEISYGSLMEVYCQMIVAKELDYINDETLSNNKQIIDKIANKLNALRRSYGKRLNTPK